MRVRWEIDGTDDAGLAHGKLADGVIAAVGHKQSTGGSTEKSFIIGSQPRGLEAGDGIARNIDLSGRAVAAGIVVDDVSVMRRCRLSARGDDRIGDRTIVFSTTQVQQYEKSHKKKETGSARKSHPH